MPGADSFFFQFAIKIYDEHDNCMTIILHVLLFCCETWSLVLRMEQRLRFFEHRMLRKIFGFERDEINRERS